MSVCSEDSDLNLFINEVVKCIRNAAAARTQLRAGWNVDVQRDTPHNTMRIVVDFKRVRGAASGSQDHIDALNQFKNQIMGAYGLFLDSEIGSPYHAIRCTFGINQSA